MHAPSTFKETESHINIIFGQNVLEKTCPINVDLTFDIFSQKNQNIKFNLQQMLDYSIEENTLLIQIIAKNGYGSELSDKILQYLKTNKKYLDKNSKGQIQIKCLSKGEKCYVFVQSQKLSQPLIKISQVCSKISVENKVSNQINEINFKIKSANDGQQIKKILDNQGGMRAAFDSFCISLNFCKTAVTQKVIQALLVEMNLPQIIGPLKSFKNLKLNVNFASAQQFDKHENMKVFGKIVKKIQTNLFNVLKNQFQNQIKVYFFNKVFSFKGKIEAQNIDSLLQALFEQVKKQE